MTVVELPEGVELPPCPSCGGELRLEARWRAKDVDAFSVAGSTVKFPVVQTYWLVCDCGFEEEGKPTGETPSAGVVD